MTKLFKTRFVISLIISIVIFPIICLAENSSSIPKGSKVSVFCVVIQDKNDIEFNSPLSSIIEQELLNKGFKVHTPSQVPLISKNQLQYTIVKNREQKDYDDKTGRLYMELGEDGTAKIESQNGISAYTKLEVSKIDWVLDKKKAKDLTKKLDVPYVLFVIAKSRDMTNEISKRSILSGQKAIKADINMNLIDLQQNLKLKSYYEETSVMDITQYSAAIKGWREIVQKGINKWFK